MASRQQPRRSTLEERISRLEVGWMEAARVTHRLHKELGILQSHVRECDASLNSVILLVNAIQEIFAAASDRVAS